MKDTRIFRPVTAYVSALLFRFCSHGTDKVETLAFRFASTKQHFEAPWPYIEKGGEKVYPAMEW